MKISGVVEGKYTAREFLRTQVPACLWIRVPSSSERACR